MSRLAQFEIVINVGVMFDGFRHLTKNSKHSKDFALARYALLFTSDKRTAENLIDTCAKECIILPPQSNFNAASSPAVKLYAISAKQQDNLALQRLSLWPVTCI